jgi:two-component system invasion response regulator UvrY
VPWYQGIVVRLHHDRGSALRERVPVPSGVHGEITVVVADDDHRVGSAVAELLDQEPDFRVVGQVANGDDAVTAARELRASLVLTDVRMPGGGPDLVRRLVDLEHQPVVAALSAQGDIATWTSMLAAGASGYLLKGAGARVLPELLRTCMLGHLVVGVPGAPDVVRRLLSR